MNFVALETTLFKIFVSMKNAQHSFISFVSTMKYLLIVFANKFMKVVIKNQGKAFKIILRRNKNIEDKLIIY